MQSSGFLSRENANAYSAVIVRESGRSSIPETLTIEQKGRGLLDTPHARGMTICFATTIPDRFAGARNDAEDPSSLTLRRPAAVSKGEATGPAAGPRGHGTRSQGR
jgi:hypothetical protein